MSEPQRARVALWLSSDQIHTFGEVDDRAVADNIKILADEAMTLSHEMTIMGACGKKECRKTGGA